MNEMPEWLLSPIKECKGFCEEYESRRMHGADVLEGCKIAVVGLARNCGSRLEANLVRLSALTSVAAGWRAMICENDSTDNTKAVIDNFKCRHPGNVASIMRDLGRKHRPNEFAGPRTAELAEYRSECQEWVRRSCGDCEYTVVIDWDSWGGWVHSGALTAFSYCATEPNSYGFASVSLLEHPAHSFNAKTQSIEMRSTWVHYDCWALRLNSTWDDYSTGVGGWKHQWFPPVGSPPVRVCSAFGGFAVYKTEDYLKGEYSGQDCEHVPFHDSVSKSTGKGLYLNPSQRTIMRWIQSDAEKGTD